MNKKLLLYAFSSWGKNNSNLSEEVLNKLDLPVDKLVLSVKFDQQPFLDLLNQGHTHIIGLGQYPQGNKIRLEQLAHNAFGTKGKGFQPIDDGPSQLKVNLQLKPTTNSELTYDAGKFVCNFSMYCILRNKKADQQYAFIHIPKRIELDEAAKYVDEIVRQVI